MKYFLFCIVSFGMLCVACNDPLESNIFTQVQTDVQVDSLIIEAKTIEEDSVVTFTKLVNNNFSATTYMVGHMVDPTFGLAQSISYFTPGLVTATNSSLRFPNMALIEAIDSVVMAIELDSLGAGGNRDDVHTLSLHALSTPFTLDNDQSLYHFEKLDFDPTPLHSITKKIDYTDSLTLSSYTNDTLDLNLPAQLRFRMDTQVWADILDTDLTTSPDSLITNDILEDLINGYALTTGSDVNSMVGINLANAASSSIIEFYVRLKNDTIVDKRVYTMNLGLRRHSSFEHDYAGSLVGDAITSGSSDLLYVQSQGGSNLEFDISSLLAADIQILNSATLQLTVMEEDVSLYKPALALFAKYKNDAGEELVVSDIGMQNFDGTLTTDGTRQYYNLDITNHVKAYLNREVKTPIIEIYAESKGRTVTRSILYGPNDPDFPAKLKLIKTNP